MIIGIKCTLHPRHEKLNPLIWPYSARVRNVQKLSRPQSAPAVSSPAHRRKNITSRTSTGNFIPRLPIIIFREHGLKNFMQHWTVKKDCDGCYVSSNCSVTRACLGLHPVVEHARRIIDRNTHTVHSITYVPDTAVQHRLVCSTGFVVLVINMDSEVIVLRDGMNSRAVNNVLLVTCSMNM